MPNEYCHCGEAINYQHCCGRFISGHTHAQSSEQLMRSRYSAFCTGKVDYLIDTLHPSQRKSDDADVLQNTIQHTTWTRLKVIDAQQTDSSHGTVEFVAFFGPKQEDQMHEHSKFVKENGRWYYLEGRQLPPHSLGRNERCWCGKPRKVKQCCGA